MTARDLPEYMTAHDPADRAWTPGQDEPVFAEDDEKHERPLSDGFRSHDVANTGLALDRYFVNHLQWTIEQQTAEDRLEELADVYPAAAKAHMLRKRRMTQEQIAAAMGISVRTVRRLLVKAERYVGRGTMSGDEMGPEEREHIYADLYADRHQVRVMMAYGWSQVQIAQQLGVSVRTVKRFAAHARVYIGDDPVRDRVRRYRKRPVKGAA